MPDSVYSHNIDHMSLALGEMREFMTHHRQQMDTVNATMSDHRSCLRQLQNGQEKSMELHNQTQVDVSDIKKSLDFLVSEHTHNKTSKKAILKGFGIGVVCMTVFAAIYYKDSDLLQVVYRHTLGIIL